MKFPQIGERQWVTIALFALGFYTVTLMAFIPDLRKDDLFKVIAQAIILTAVVNGIVAFHFSSNKGAETARENTGKAFDALTAVAGGAPSPAPDNGGAQLVADGAQAAADGAQDVADAVAGREAK